MTKYWPLSVIAEHPAMQHPAFAAELRDVYKTCFLSEQTFYACGDVARHTPDSDMPGLAVLESVNAPWRQVFTDYPSRREWAALERAGVLEGSNGMLYVIIDALH